MRSLNVIWSWRREPKLTATACCGLCSESFRFKDPGCWNFGSRIFGPGARRWGWLAKRVWVPLLAASAKVRIDPLDPGMATLPALFQLRRTRHECDP